MYAFKPAQDAAVSISLCGSSYDTVLALYRRSSDWAALQEVSCNDDFCGSQSYLEVHASAYNLIALSDKVQYTQCTTESTPQSAPLHIRR